jgi:hypothetical protein
LLSSGCTPAVTDSVAWVSGHIDWPTLSQRVCLACPSRWWNVLSLVFQFRVGCIWS